MQKQKTSRRKRGKYPSQKGVSKNRKKKQKGVIRGRLRARQIARRRKGSKKDILQVVTDCDAYGWTPELHTVDERLKLAKKMTRWVSVSSRKPALDRLKKVIKLLTTMSENPLEDKDDKTLQQTISINAAATLAFEDASSAHREIKLVKSILKDTHFDFLQMQQGGAREGRSLLDWRRMVHNQEYRKNNKRSASGRMTIAYEDVKNTVLEHAFKQIKRKRNYDPKSDKLIDEFQRIPEDE